MLDILGAMSLTAIAAIGVAALSLAGSPRDVRRNRLVLLASGWFVTIAFLGALGVFSQAGGRGTLAIGVAVVAPVLVGLIAYARSRPVRATGFSVPLAVLVGIHAGRLLGGFFVALYEAGRLPPTFALTAGWGDVLIGAAAAPLAWMIHRGAPGWRTLALIWNTAGLLDLLTAVSLGVGSAPDSPLRFLFESPNSGAVATLPWVMIPGFLVPLYLLTHLTVFVRLAAGAATEGRLSVQKAEAA